MPRLVCTRGLPISKTMQSTGAALSWCKVTSWGLSHLLHSLRKLSATIKLTAMTGCIFCTIQVKYGSAVVGGASHPATFVRVYDLCGPTYPGEYDSAENLYLLHYPGLLFLFPIPAQHAQHCSQRSGDLPLELPDGTTPVAARICIYSGPAGESSWVCCLCLEVEICFLVSTDLAGEASRYA